MDDLDELKGRVERATRVLSEREAEEQGRHATLVALIAALEAKSLEARREKQRAETLLSAAKAENEDLRSLLVGLLDAVEAGSRSRFAEAVYALEARIGGLSSAAEVQDDAAAGPEQEAGRPGGPSEASGALPEALAQAEPQQPAEASGGGDPDDFTASLAASSAVEEEIAKEDEERRLEAADEARLLLERIRRQVELSDTAAAPADDEPADEPADEPPDETCDPTCDPAGDPSEDEPRLAAS